MPVVFLKAKIHYMINHIPVGTELELNVHKTLRRRPGRLLNVSSTFNLRPVSTGTWFLKSRTILHFSYWSYVIFSGNDIELVFLTNKILEMNMSQILKTKCIVNFRKRKSRIKSLDLVELKWQNQIKLKKLDNR